MSEISKFYLSRKQFQNFESGSLFKYDGDNLSHIERPRYMKLTTSIPEDWKTIPPLEAFYLKGKFVEQRDNLLKKRFFNKISLLKKDDKCYYINGNIIDKCTICDHIEKNDELHFIIETKDGTKKVPAYDIQLEDEDVVRAPITEYYLLIDKYFDYEPGTLIVYKSGKIFTYKEKQKLVGCIEDLQKISVPISLNYAEFLHKFPVRDRSFKVLQEIQADLQYARGDRFDYLKVTHSFKVEEIVNFTKDDYVKLESLSKEDKIDYFESDIYISWTCVALEKLQSKLEANDFLALNFTQLSLQIVCKTMRKSKTFIRMVKDNANFMKKLACLFDYMAKKEKLTYKESDLLCTILSMYWCILRVEKPLDNSIFDNLKHIFYYRDTTYENKLGAALCLTNLIDAQSSLSEDLIKYFIECSDRKSLEPFSCEEVFIGLGKQQFKTEYNKINIKDKGGLRKSVSEGQALQEPDNVDNSINVLTNSFTCGQSPNITDDTHHHLKFLYEYQSKIECNYMNKFIDVTQHFVKIILNNLGKEKGELNNKVVRDCAMTVLSVFCDLLHSDKCFPKMVADNHRLMYSFKRLFETLANRDKLISMEVQFLENIIFIYWNILKSIKEIKFEPSTETMEKCYSGSKFNIQIKIAAAMCLTSLRKHPAQFLKEIKSYLINIYERDSGTEAFGFSNADFTTAIENISLNVDVSDDKSTDDVDRSLSVITSTFKFCKIPDITEDTHNHFKILYTNQLQIVEKYMNEFIDVTRHFVDIILKHIKCKRLVIEAKAMRDCSMTDLSIFCDLCDSNEDFVVKVVTNTGLMISIKGLLENLASECCPTSMQIQFLENTIFIFWNILKFGEYVSLLPSVENMKNCYDNNNMSIQIKTAAALCIAYAYHDSEELLQRVEGYLTELCIKYKSREIHGFPRGEIYTALGKMDPPLLDAKPDLRMILGNAPHIRITSRETTSSFCVKINRTIYPCLLNAIDEHTIDLTDGDNNTLLHLCAVLLLPDMCHQLILRSASVTKVNDRGETPLLSLIQGSYNKYINKYNKEGGYGDNNTIMEKGVAGGRADVGRASEFEMKMIKTVDVLIAAGSSVNVETSEGFNLFRIATEYNSEKLLLALIKRREHITAVKKAEWLSWFHKQLFVFIAEAIPLINKLMLSNWITVDLIKCTATVADLTLAKALYDIAEIDVYTSAVETLLHKAATNDDENLFEDMSKDEISSKSSLAGGESLLNCLVRERRTRLCRILLDSRNSALLLEKKDVENKLPLHVCIERDNWDIIDSLIWATKSVNEEDNYGHTPLSLLLVKISETEEDAIIGRLMGCINVLITRSADVYRVNKLGKPVISYCTKISFQRQIERFFQQHRPPSESVAPNSSTSEAGADDNRICSICCDEWNNCVLTCGHMFCMSCVDKVVYCYVCRRLITDKRRIFM